MHVLLGPAALGLFPPRTILPGVDGFRSGLQVPAVFSGGQVPVLPGFLLGAANGNSQWEPPMGTANGNSQWEALAGCGQTDGEEGQGFWFPWLVP